MSDARNYDERLLAQEDRAYRDSDARDYTRANRLHRRIGKAIARPGRTFYDTRTSKMQRFAQWLGVVKFVKVPS